MLEARINNEVLLSMVVMWMSRV